MTRRIRALNHGRARVWWVHHGREAVRAMQLTMVIVLWMIASHFSYQDELDMERAAREAAEARAEAAAGFERRLPPVTFVLEARTPQELELRLAEIAGELDAVRARRMGGAQ